MALFALALFFCFFIHEMGHALVGRMLGGGTPEIYLAWLGGDCYNEGIRLSRMQGALMTAAGPLTSILLPLVLVWPAISIASGGALTGLITTVEFALGRVPAALLEQCPPMALLFGVYLVQISVWWAILNLLPVHPLDGGQMMHGLMSSPRRMHSISLSFAGVLSFFFLALGAWWMVCIMVSLAVFNYRCMQCENE